jgi:SAM-dependent methyltransferase
MSINMPAAGLRCPLCQGSELKHLQPIPADTIIEIYGQALSEVVRAEFGETGVVSFVVCQSCDLRFFSPAVAGSERLYDVLQKSEFYYQAEKPEFEYARSLIEVEDDVLEIGCGAGAFGSSVKPGSYLGLELTPSAAAQARALGLCVLEQTIENHADKHSASYDVVCAFQVLEHIAEPGRFISNCLEVLRPGGRLVLSIPSAESFAGDLPNHALDLPPHHITRWSDRCLSGLKSIFPVSIEAIWNEPLRPIHYRLALQSRFYRTLWRLRGREVLPVDRSSIGRLTLWLGWKLSKLFAFAESLLPRRGISVTVVLRKLV